MASKGIAVAMVLAITLLGGGCSLESTPPTPTCVVQKEFFEIQIKGAGELEAARATPIVVPQRLRGRQQVLWLAEEGDSVEEDDLIARMAGEDLEIRTRRTRDSIRTLDYSIGSKTSELEKERQKIEAHLGLLRQEKSDAERYAPRDPALFSRNEILDAEVDLELLETKIEHALARLARYTERSEAELEILRLQKQTQAVRLSQLEQALGELEVRAPHDGVFYPSRSWRGERVRKGSTVWSGMELGELPDLSEMEAKVHILESEAAGLDEELEVTVRLDAHPGVSFAGTVQAIEPIANPIEEDSPVKYFEVTISLARTDSELMRPRGQVEVQVFVSREEGVFSVPNQALFHQGEESWVWVQMGGSFEKRPVRVGQRSISRTVVVDGLGEGERVALARPFEPLGGAG